MTLNAAGPYADVQHMPGRLYYSQSWSCPTGNGSTVGSDFFWARARSTRLKPHCTPLREWHVIAGYPGKAVATLDYKAPAALSRSGDILIAGPDAGGASPRSLARRGRSIPPST
jgi:hypothetical protein